MTVYQFFSRSPPILVRPEVMRQSSHAMLNVGNNCTENLYRCHRFLQLDMSSTKSIQ